MHLFFTSKIHAPDAANTSALMGLGNHNCPYAIPNFATLPKSYRVVPLRSADGARWFTGQGHDVAVEAE